MAILKTASSSANSHARMLPVEYEASHPGADQAQPDLDSWATRHASM